MDQNTHHNPKRIIRLREVSARVGLSRSTIYEKISVGDFPAPVSLGGRRVGWWEAEVDEWITSRPRVALRKGV
ncbi:MAG: helix-turn-helix transcriptional regulator [Leptospirillia bacterium]